MSDSLVNIDEPDRDGLDRIAADMAAFGDACAAMFDAARGPFNHGMATLAAAFGCASYIPPGWGRPPDGEPIRTGYDALYALNWAADTVILKRLPKPARRYAKARYLECRRIIGPTAWRGHCKRRGGVAVNQFVST